MIHTCYVSRMIYRTKKIGREEISINFNKILKSRIIYRRNGVLINLFILLHAPRIFLKHASDESSSDLNYYPFMIKRNSLKRTIESTAFRLNVIVLNDSISI